MRTAVCVFAAHIYIGTPAKILSKLLRLKCQPLPLHHLHVEHLHFLQYLIAHHCHRLHLCAADFKALCGGCPMIIGADLNSLPESEVYARLLSPERGVVGCPEVIRCAPIRHEARSLTQFCRVCSCGTWTTTAALVEAGLIWPRLMSG